MMNTALPPRPKKLAAAAWLALAGLSLAACTGEARLYANTGQIIRMEYTGKGLGSGSVSGAFPDGEPFSGEWYQHVGIGFGTGLMTAGPRLMTMNVTTINPGAAFVTAVGTQGTLLECIAYPQAGRGFGECQDSKGRRYRMHI